VVIVLDDARAAAVLGDRNATLVPFEMMCPSEDECDEVTSTLVAREGFVRDHTFRDYYLTLDLGLEPTAKAAPPADEQPAE